MDKREAFAMYGPIFAGVVATLALAGAPAAAQTTLPAPTSAPGVTYADPGFGFELRLPAGWQYDRTRFQQFKDSIGLLRGHAPDGRRGLQIMVFRTFDMKPFEDWIVDFGKATLELTNSPRVDWETWRLPPRAGAIFSYTSKLGAITTRSHCLCVPFDPSTIWVLTYSGSMGSEAEAEPIRREFDQVAGSLRIHYDPAEAAQLAPALDRGKALLAKLRSEAAHVAVDETEHTYELIVAGKPVGYMTRSVTRGEYVFSASSATRRDAKEGLRVRERSWRFGEDGSARYGFLDLFSSFDMQSEQMKNQQVQIPPPDVQPQEAFVRTDEVIRERDVLLSSTTTSRDTGLPEASKPIRVGPVYLDQAWVRVLPLLLRDAPSETHAVAVYDGDTRALLLHTIKPLGERKLDGYDGVARAYEVRAGFIDRPSLVYCDDRGILLRAEAGELVVTRISRQEAERKYSARRDAAQRRCSLQLE
jgi:hypothetical protein